MAMKYAFMTFSTPGLTLVETLQLAKDLGYAGIEPRTDSNQRHGIEIATSSAEREAIRQTVEQSGVALAALALSARFADQSNVESHMHATAAAIRLAADVGCPRLRVFGGSFNESLGRHTAINTASDALKKLGDEAAKHDVTICLETHDAWCDPRDVAALMQAVDHPAVRVNWDVLHTKRVAGFSPKRTWELIGSYVGHVHFHDGLDKNVALKLVPIGEGIVDHGQVLQVLKDNGYQEFLSGEWISGLMDADFYEDHLGPEIEKMKQLEAGLG